MQSRSSFATRPRRRRRACRSASLALLVCTLLSAACAEKLPEEKPEAPDMAALLADYEAPTLPFDENTAPDIVTALIERVPILGSFCGWSSVDDITCDEQGSCGSCTAFDELVDIVRGLDGDASTQSSALTAGQFAVASQPLTVGGEVFEGEGFMRVERICDGGDPTAEPNLDANGKLNLIVGFTDAGIDPVVWGTFEACHLVIDGHDVVLDAELRVHWLAEQGLDFDTLEGLSAVFELDGDVAVDGTTYRVHDDVRVLADGTLELRVSLEAGHVLFFVTNEQSAAVQGFRATNGTFACDFATAECMDGAGTVVSY